MIIAIIFFFFLSYLIFDQQLKLISENPQLHLKKFTPPPLFLLTPPHKNSKSASPLLFAKNFQPLPPWRKGGGQCGNTNSR